MKRTFLLFVTAIMAASVSFAAGYKVGDKAKDFKLLNLDGKYQTLSELTGEKGMILVFTCNTCPVAQAYQDRIIAIDKKYRSKGYPVVAVNPNDTDIKPGDNLESMVQRASEKGFTFPYLKDVTQEAYREYGATVTPHVFVLTREAGDFVVSYIGAIDDNTNNPSAVKTPYLANALDALLAGNEPNPSFTKAIGCSIKAK